MFSHSQAHSWHQPFCDVGIQDVFHETRKPDEEVHCPQHQGLHCDLEKPKNNHNFGLKVLRLITTVCWESIYWSNSFLATKIELHLNHSRMVPSIVPRPRCTILHDPSLLRNFLCLGHKAINTDFEFFIFSLSKYDFKIEINAIQEQELTKPTCI